MRPADHAHMQGWAASSETGAAGANSLTVSGFARDPPIPLSIISFWLDFVTNHENGLKGTSHTQIGGCLSLRWMIFE
jgi:hypothetical protein